MLKHCLYHHSALLIVAMIFYFLFWFLNFCFHQLNLLITELVANYFVYVG